MCGGPGIICMGPPIGGLMPPESDSDRIHSFMCWIVATDIKCDTGGGGYLNLFSFSLLILCKLEFDRLTPAAYWGCNYG